MNIITIQAAYLGVGVLHTSKDKDIDTLMLLTTNYTYEPSPSPRGHFEKDKRSLLALVKLIRE